MYAIETYFIGPTNFRGSRICARVMERGTGRAGEHKTRKLILNWDHALNPANNHRLALITLATRLGWGGRWVEGGSDDGASVWINTSVGADEIIVAAEVWSDLKDARLARRTAAGHQ